MEWRTERMKGDDDLSTFKGIGSGCLVSAILWVLVVAAAVALVHLLTP